MNQIFEKIYREVICNEEDMYDFGRKMENEVNEIVADYKHKMNEEELERLTEQIDLTVSSAKQEAFFRCAFLQSGGWYCCWQMERNRQFPGMPELTKKER